MVTKKNPFIEPYDHFEGYKESIEKLKNNPELVEVDKLCYELFHLNEQGRNFMELVQKRYLIPPLAHLNSPNYQLACIWAEGFKDAFRMIKNSVESHSQRIKAETNT